MSTALAQLSTLLDSLQSRVAELEKRAGVPAGFAAVSAAAVGGAGAGAAASDDDEPTATTREFDALVAKFGEELEKVSKDIGGDVAVIGAAVHALWKENRKMLHIASKCKKPAADVLGELRKGVAAAGKPIADAKASRDCKAPNHAAGANDAASAFFWVNVEAGPLDIITSAREGCDFFLNKVRKQSKDENDPRHMAFANLIRDGLAALFDFVKANFKMGISWNPKGADAAAFAAGAGAAKFAAAAAAPAAAAAAAPAAAAAAAGGAGGADPAALQSALFKQLSSIDQSSGRTAGLRHVTKDMKSKPGDAPAVVPAAAAAAGGAGAAKAAPAAAAGRREDAVPTGAPRVALVDKRYYVEFQQERGAQVHVPAPGGAALTIAQEVYIYACKDVAVFIDSKCKGVRVDKCHNVTIIVESVLSGIEVVNCKKMKIQVKQSLPSVAIDKTDGIIVGLAWTARDAQIVTSKSSEMNVTFPVSEAEDAEWVEMPIPEQFVTKITAANKLHSHVSELYTH